MTYASICDGIGAVHHAWAPLGWECKWVSEIDRFPAAVVGHNFGFPNLGDLRKLTAEGVAKYGHLDLVVAGFPCQDLSVAGNRKGLKNADGSTTRSGLFFAIVALCDAIGQRWTVLENVPGLLSSNKGEDFGTVVGTLCGATFDVPPGGWATAGVAVGPKGLVEWRILDAQYAGVPQRRRRVFIVRDSGNWAGRPPVLLIPSCLQGYPPPSREAEFTAKLGPEKNEVVFTGGIEHLKLWTESDYAAEQENNKAVKQSEAYLAAKKAALRR